MPYGGSGTQQSPQTAVTAERLLGRRKGFGFDTSSREQIRTSPPVRCEWTARRRGRRRNSRALRLLDILLSSRVREPGPTA
jgi:hypothetical protein